MELRRESCPVNLILYEENYPFVSSVLAAAEGHSRAQPVLVKKVIADSGARSVLGGGALHQAASRQVWGHAEAGPGQGPLISYRRGLEAQRMPVTEGTTKSLSLQSQEQELPEGVFSDPCLFL